MMPLSHQWIASRWPTDEDWPLSPDRLPISGRIRWHRLEAQRMDGLTHMLSGDALSAEQRRRNRHYQCVAGIKRRMK